MPGKRAHANGLLRMWPSAAYGGYGGARGDGWATHTLLAKCPAVGAPGVPRKSSNGDCARALWVWRVSGSMRATTPSLTLAACLGYTCYSCHATMRALARLDAVPSHDNARIATGIC